MSLPVTITLSPKARVALYLGAAIALIVIGYAVDKDWAGDAEVRLVTALAALANMVAAGNVKRRSEHHRV